MCETVRRSLMRVHSGDGQQQASLVILRSGRVLLQIRSGAVIHDLFATTLEEISLLAAMEPLLNAELYSQLTWELDLMGPRGR